MNKVLEKTKKQYQDAFNTYQENLEKATIVEEVIIAKQKHLIELITLFPLEIIENKNILKNAEKSREKLLDTLKNYYRGEEYKEEVIKEHIISLYLESRLTYSKYNNIISHGIKTEKFIVIIEKLLAHLPLAARQCYFYLQFNGTCNNCPYALQHGECKYYLSDFQQIKKACVSLELLLKKEIIMIKNTKEFINFTFKKERNKK